MTSEMAETVGMASGNTVSDQEDGLLSYIPLALLSGVAVILFNTMPVFLGEAGDSLGWSNARLGGLISAFFAGNTLTYLVIGFTINRLNWVLCARVAALAAAAVFALMALLVPPDFYPYMMFVAGLCSGTIYVFAMTAFARSEHAARNIGLGFLFQLSLGALAVYLFPVVVTPLWGFDGLLLSFAVVYAFAALISGALYGRESREPEQDLRMELKFRPLAGLLGLVIFFAGMTAVWAFIERIGISAGFDQEYVGTVLSVSLFVGGLASLATVALGDRWGYRLPVSIAASLVVVSLLGLGFDLNTVSYTVGVLIFQFSWVLGVNYIAASIAFLDTTDRYAAFFPGAMGVGSIIGPASAGFLIDTSILPLILMGSGCAAITIVVFNILLRPH